MSVWKGVWASQRFPTGGGVWRGGVWKKHQLADAIGKAFFQGQIGWAYDHHDDSTLFTDSAGTTPAVLEDPIGLQLDKSGNGNHRFQDVSADRPILSARYNLLTKTEDFADAVWDKSGLGTGLEAVVTSNYAEAPDGSMTATRVQFDLNGGLGSSSNRSWINYNTTSFDTACEIECWFKVINGSDATFTFSATGGDTVTVAADAWVKASKTLTYSYISLRFGLIGSTASSETLDLLVWHPSFLPVQEADLPYQRVNTATDYDGDKSKFPRYLSCNGTNTRMETASLAPGSDNVAAFMGLRKFSDAATGIAFTFGASGADGSFTLYTPDGAASNAAFQSRGTLSSKATATGLTAPLSLVATAIGDIAGDSASLGIDGGTAVVSASDQGTGNYGILAAEFFANTDGTLFANMREYSSVVRFGPITSDETNAIEQYIASRVPGVTV